jgi:transposase-like protein
LNTSKNATIKKWLKSEIIGRKNDSKFASFLNYGMKKLVFYQRIRECKINCVKGKSKKKIKGEFGEAEIAVPRDRLGEFQPTIVEKGQTHFTGFDNKILALYARGMTTRDIQSTRGTIRMKIR